MTREFVDYFLIPHNGGEIEAEVIIEYDADGWSTELSGSIYVLSVRPGEFRYVSDGEGNFPHQTLTDEEVSSISRWLENKPLYYFVESAFKNEANL